MGLNVYISAERLRRFSDQPDISLGIYDRWLRCQTLARTFNPKFWESLTQQFTDITIEAPGFGRYFTDHMVRIDYTDGQWGEGRVVPYGPLQLDPATATSGADPYPAGGYNGRNFYNGGSFAVGDATSPELVADFGFYQAIASWNADTPAGSWIETSAWPASW